MRMPQWDRGDAWPLNCVSLGGAPLGGGCRDVSLMGGDGEGVVGFGGRNRAVGSVP